MQTLAVSIAALLATARAHFSACPGSQSVKVANLMRGQNITTPMVVIHHKDVHLMEFGEPASAELASLAETGGHDALMTYLASADMASFICGMGHAESPVGPGESAYIEIEVEETGNCTCADAAVTVLGKVSWSNDAFIALDAAMLPIAAWNTLAEHHARWIDVPVPAYDVGTEGNTERCIDIGGCPADVVPIGNAPNVASNAAALAGEGFIYISQGISGDVDLPWNEFGWLNPVASVSLHSRLPPGVTEAMLPINEPFGTWIASNARVLSGGAAVVSASAAFGFATALVAAAGLLL